MLLHKFQINDLISLELKDNYIYVYINNKEVLVCKGVAVDIRLADLRELEKIESVDDLSDKYGKKENHETKRLISPEDEFLVHCSNIQAWAESGYNTKLIHSNIVFPLLRILNEVGDSQARKVYKEEIVKRYKQGSRRVQRYLASEGYLKTLNNTERELLFKENLEEIKQIEDSIKIKLKFANNVELSYGIELYNGEIEGLRINCKHSKIPHQIKNLKNLKKLILESFIDTRLPDWIGSLSEMEHLNLSNNQLEEIPNSIGKLNKLKYLNLGVNKITKLPKSISNLQNLRIFYLHRNQINKFPNGICALKELRRLILARNSIESVPVEILNVKELFEFNLDFNPIESLPLEIFFLPKLHFISLRDSKIKINEKISELIKKRDLIVYLE